MGKMKEKILNEKRYLKKFEEIIRMKNIEEIIRLKNIERKRCKRRVDLEKNRLKKVVT